METATSNITSLVEPDEVPFRAAPHNIEAEQALLGAILVNNDACDKFILRHETSFKLVKKGESELMTLASIIQSVILK